MTDTSDLANTGIAATTESAGATSAAHEVFALPKLAEMIYANLSLKDLVLMTRTCKQAHAIYHSVGQGQTYPRTDVNASLPFKERIDFWKPLSSPPGPEKRRFLSLRMPAAPRINPTTHALLSVVAFERGSLYDGEKYGDKTYITPVKGGLWPHIRLAQLQDLDKVKELAIMFLPAASDHIETFPITVTLGGIYVDKQADGSGRRSEIGKVLKVASDADLS